jgi:precorrin-8X/cobalt-precorrin-8 methylmutase
MKKALLLIDRGSKEQDVKDELHDICSMAKERGSYYFSNYAFLEVTPPYIEEGIHSCVKHGVEFLTIMPYFLYPGMKLKLAVKQSEKIARELGLSFAVTECLNYHSSFVGIVKDRINEVKRQENVNYLDKEIDIVLIGHGSSDSDARDAFVYIADSINRTYRNVGFCFLELDTPNIADGIKQAMDKKPRILILVPYFLHRGAHIKRDVKEEVAKALQKYNFSNVYTAKHLGVDSKIIDVIIERAKEVEKKFGI